MTALSAIVGLVMLVQLTPPQVIPADKLVLVYLSTATLKSSPDLEKREQLQAKVKQYLEEELKRKRKIMKLVDTRERADVVVELGEAYPLTDGYFEAAIVLTLGREMEEVTRASPSVFDLCSNLGLATEEWIDAHQSH